MFSKEALLEFFALNGTCAGCDNASHPIYTEELSERNSNIRARALVSCKYAEDGCDAELLIDEVEDHEEQCVIACAICGKRVV